MSDSYFLYGFILEKCGNFWKNGRFSGRIWPDWGNTAWADMAGLGSIGLKRKGGTFFLVLKVIGTDSFLYATLHGIPHGAKPTDNLKAYTVPELVILNLDIHRIKKTSRRLCFLGVWSK